MVDWAGFMWPAVPVWPRVQVGAVDDSEGSGPVQMPAHWEWTRGYRLPVQKWWDRDLDGGFWWRGWTYGGGLPVARWGCKELRNEDEEVMQAADWFEGERERPAVVGWCMT